MYYKSFLIKNASGLKYLYMKLTLLNSESYPTTNIFSILYYLCSSYRISYLDFKNTQTNWIKILIGSWFKCATHQAMIKWFSV